MAAKTIFGVGAKVFDNVIDQSLGVSAASDFLTELPDYLLVDKPFSKSDTPSEQVARACATMLKAGQFQFLEDVAREQESFQSYSRDLREGAPKHARCLELQKAHPYDAETTEYQFRDFLESRNVGIIWFDIDAGLLEKTNPQAWQKIHPSLQSLRKAYAGFFESYLLYDDVTDVESDRQTGSWNAVLVENAKCQKARNTASVGLRAEDCLARAKELTIQRADRIFAESSNNLVTVGRPTSDRIDFACLDSTFRFVRLFFLRKLIGTINFPSLLKRVVECLLVIRPIRRRTAGSGQRSP